VRRAIGVALSVLVVATLPLASACYPARVESCRDPMSDFSSFSNIAISDPHQVIAFESATASVELQVTASTTLPSGDRCVAVRSELHDARGGLVEVLDTPIRAHVIGGVLTTTQILHYHTSQLTPLTVHVTALGTTLDATVVNPRLVDAGATRFSDAGRDAAPRLTDSSVIDAGFASDTGVIDAGDAGSADADVDASTSDGGDTGL